MKYWFFEIENWYALQRLYKNAMMIMHDKKCQIEFFVMQNSLNDFVGNMYFN